VWLFVYGTLMDPEKAKRIFGRLPKAKVAFLPGYDLAFDKEGMGRGNPNLRRGKGVWGVIYDLSEEDVRRLDRVSPKYSRREVEVIVDGERVRAWVYVAKPEYVKEGLEPDRSCVERMIRGAKFHGLPEDYVARLESLLRSLEERRNHGENNDTVRQQGRRT